MKKIILCLVSFVVALTVLAESPAEPDIIPRPNKIERLAGAFEIKANTVIYTPREFYNEAKFLAGAVYNSTKIRLQVKKGSGVGITLRLAEKQKLPPEGYQLTVINEGIQIVAGDAAGAFYAVQTLLQTLPPAVTVGKPYQGKLLVPAMRIEDAPRFAWRAFMLDEARHFKGLKEVEKLLDQMAMHKMNVFHWHLTDDQGWRIEINKYPKLTSVGGTRKDTQLETWGSPKRAGKPHSGFYTQKQIRHLVRYAQQRHITIVPEIGMPGHAVAAIASYPFLGCTGQPVEVMDNFDHATDIYNPARETTYQFVSDVLDEVAQLFPGRVIHIGGDEVRYSHWQSSAEVKAMMAEKGLKTMADVQIYFTNRVVKIVESKGKHAMGWNEILGQNVHGTKFGGESAESMTLDPQTVIHFWKGSPHLAKRAIEDGHDVINSTAWSTYLDYSYAKISLEKAYSFDPIIGGLDAKYHHKIKGFGCQMWGEWIPTVEAMEKQVFPRLSAYAEVGWTNLSRKDFTNFKARMRTQAKRWQLLGTNYYADAVNKLTAADLFNYTKIGQWNPQSVGMDFKTLSFEVTEQISGKGNFEVGVLYQKGAHAVDIQSVALLQNGKQVSIDRHRGYSGSDLKDILYQLKVTEYTAGDTFTIQVTLKGSGGHDTYGEVKMTAK